MKEGDKASIAAIANIAVNLRLSLNYFRQVTMIYLGNMVLCHNYVSKTYLFFIIITACEEELYLIRLYCYIFWSSVFVAFLALHLIGF